MGATTINYLGRSPISRLGRTGGPALVLPERPPAGHGESLTQNLPSVRPYRENCLVPEARSPERLTSLVDPASMKGSEERSDPMGRVPRRRDLRASARPEPAAFRQQADPCGRARVPFDGGALSSALRPNFGYLAHPPLLRRGGRGGVDPVASRRKASRPRPPESPARPRASSG